MLKNSFTFTVLGQICSDEYSKGLLLQNEYKRPARRSPTGEIFSLLSSVRCKCYRCSSYGPPVTIGLGAHTIIWLFDRSNGEPVRLLSLGSFRNLPVSEDLLQSNPQYSFIYLLHYSPPHHPIILYGIRRWLLRPLYKVDLPQIRQHSIDSPVCGCPEYKVELPAHSRPESG